ncbi:GNAT family N-acetyltransferase [Massilia eburnea]|uniref:GNAT family N-acetyltransferase n=1 Tax=Massilia eburnea TaxID=1776165 RepID=UPI003D6A7561
MGELWKLYVAPGHKGRGVGTALVNKVIELLREGGFDELLVEMTEQSHPFWEKFVSGRTFTQTDYNKITIPISPI